MVTNPALWPDFLINGTLLKTIRLLSISKKRILIPYLK